MLWLILSSHVVFLHDMLSLQMLTEMFTSEEPDDAFCEVLLMTTSKLVMAHHVTLTMREQGLLLHSAYKLQAHNDLLHGFTDTVLDLPLFEKVGHS